MAATLRSPGTAKKKIDFLDVPINGMLKGKVATVQFQSSFTSDIGTAEITYIDVTTIQRPEESWWIPSRVYSSTVRSESTDPFSTMM